MHGAGSGGLGLEIEDGGGPAPAGDSARRPAAARRPTGWAAGNVIDALDARRAAAEDLAVSLLDLLYLVEHAKRESPACGAELLPKRGTRSAKPITDAEELAGEFLKKAAQLVGAASEPEGTEPFTIRGWVTEPKTEDREHAAALVLELTLKHLLAAQKMSNELTRGESSTRADILDEAKELGHDARKTFAKLGASTRNEILAVHKRCTHKYRELCRVTGRQTATLDETLQWVKRAPSNRYPPEELREQTRGPYVPLGGAWHGGGRQRQETLPCFPAELVEWAENRFRSRKPERTHLELLEALSERLDSGH